MFDIAGPASVERDELRNYTYRRSSSDITASSRTDPGLHRPKPLTEWS
jgi:hypothetical protein